MKNLERGFYTSISTSMTTCEKTTTVFLCLKGHINDIDSNEYVCPHGCQSLVEPTLWSLNSVLHNHKIDNFMNQFGVW